MDKTQNAIATGLKAASARDKGALFAIANKMRSDVTAYNRVRKSADRASSILDTGIAAGESIIELLNEMRGKALAGTQANALIANLDTQLATRIAGAKRLDVHKTFVDELQDALGKRIGAILDADLAKESAKLQALQVKQQLGVQALSITNSSSQSALSLFR